MLIESNANKKFDVEIIVRKININDAQEIAVLCSQLGYPMSIDQIMQNMHNVMDNKDHDAFVAVLDNKIIGWIGITNSIQLELPSYTEVHGLVVNDTYRNHGIGKKLINKAKEWAKEKGHTKLGLHCNVKRTEAHKFYGHLGFKEIKQQKVFEIEI